MLPLSTDGHVLGCTGDIGAGAGRKVIVGTTLKPMGKPDIPGKDMYMSVRSQWRE
jgi:hypothetical protein